MSPESLPQLTAGITPDDVRWYVLGRGWNPVQSRNEAVTIFTSPKRDAQIQEPMRGDDRDVRIMMGEILRILASIEERPLDDVNHDVRHPFEDVLRLRVQSRLSESGTLPLNTGLKLFEGGKKLLVSAACSVVSPQPFYPRKGFKQVDDFVSKCQIGQTAIGSYVATILCPPLPPTKATLFEENELNNDLPFERQVTERLMQGLNVLSQGIQTGDQSIITGGVQQGVSADLCDALSSITPPNDHSILSVEMAWSPVRPKTRIPISRTLRFAAPDLAFIHRAGGKLRDQFEREDTIRGRIITLREQSSLIPEERRAVEIRTRIDSKCATVRFSLNEPEYLKACDAFRDKREVSVKGMLRRGEQSKYFELEAPVDFTRLP